MMQKYKGFAITIYPIYESQESRIARGDWQSKVIGQKVFARVDRSNQILKDVGKIWLECEILDCNKEQALEQAETIIDEFYANCD